MFYNLAIQALEPPVEGATARGSFLWLAEAVAEAALRNVTVEAVTTFDGATVSDVLANAQAQLLAILTAFYEAGERMPQWESIGPDTVSISIPFAWRVYPQGEG